MGPPLAVYDRPASLFVAAFIGSPPMNFLEGEVQGASGLRLADGTTLDLPAPLPGTGHVTLGIRPEHLFLAETGWPLVVSVVEPTGSETQITGRVAGQTIRILVRGRTDARPGDTLRLAARPADLHVFDHATGQRRDIGL